MTNLPQLNNLNRSIFTYSENYLSKISSCSLIYKFILPSLAWNNLEETGARRAPMQILLFPAFKITPLSSAKNRAPWFYCSTRSERSTSNWDKGVDLWCGAPFSRLIPKDDDICIAAAKPRWDRNCIKFHWKCAFKSGHLKI